MVELKSGSPVWGPQQRLQGAGEIDEHVAHQEEPKETDEGKDRKQKSKNKNHKKGS